MDPRNEGVKVRTTPRKLIEAGDKWLAKRTDDVSLHLGAITYCDDAPQRLVNRLNEIGPKKLGKGEDRIRSLLLKRPSFQHESEVRLICLAPFGVGWDTLPVDIDPNAVFDEVQFDPRLSEFERKEREALAKHLGYLGAITRDLRYMRTFFDVLVSRSWDDEEPSSDGGENRLVKHPAL